MTLEVMATLIGALIGAIPGFITAYIQSNQKKKAKKQLEDIFKPSPVGKDVRSSIMLLGLGGSGKTTLIRRLVNDDRANPQRKTEEFEIYPGKRAFTIDAKESICHFWISDYKGQDLGTLTRAFVEQQKIPNSPMAYGYINALIVIVDLIKPKSNAHEPEPLPTDEPDLKRVQDHIDQWNDQAIDAISGFLTTELKYVCLFINKVDLLNDHSDVAKKRYISLFNDIHKRLIKKFGDGKIFVILGSAKKNALDELPDSLMKNADSD